MVRKRIAITVATVACLVLAACGGSDSSSTPSSGGASSSGGGSSTASAGTGDYGNGLKLGETISSVPVGRSLEPWFRWNGKTCKMEETDDHPADYKADLRKVTGGDSRIAYMHYGDTDPFGVANSKSVKATAAKAGMQLDVYNLKFPSRSEPISVAQAAVVKKDRGALQANLDPSILPRFFQIIEGDGCMPSVQLYIPIDGHPGMGANWPDVGTEIGKYIAQQAVARKWDPEQTALVHCTDPDSGPTVNAMFVESTKVLSSGDFVIPKKNVFDLVCKVSETTSGQRHVTDWYTAHPGFKYVAFDAVDSIRMQSMIRAVKAEGAPKENTILADGTLDESDKRSVRSGDQDMSLDFFGDKYGEWLIPIIQDLMAGNPVPRFVGTKLVAVTGDNINDLYPQ